ncbi:ABC transporter substrate-binding protein [Micromonospora zhanjiangensis]|uniref:ABC transporter substrate-binding protein n=1 Tax=Micromonospora zhanjiangensis TaxID=1522057 RepID=A0ABV8KUK6_9ACTN
MLVSRGPRGVALAACTALLFTVSACGNDTAQPETPIAVRLYGSDGNMQNGFGKELKDQAGLLNGMKGTIPLTQLPQSFKSRMVALNNKLTDYLYAGETYDAVVISALAAQLAGSTAPADIAAQIDGVTNGGERCESAATCLELAREGVDIEYRGPSLTRGGFTDAGEPSTASYATLHFNLNGQIDDGKTEFVGAGDESAASKKAPPPAKKQQGGKNDKKDGSPLKIGGLLPQTGDLAFAYPPMKTAADLAIKDINAAGGALGDPVQWVDGDDGTNPAVAKATVAKHVGAGVSVIIGAAASGISRAVLPDVVAAGLIMFSPSNTDAGLSTVEDKGLYFRTAPSDILQGRALADVILRDGPKKIAIVARKDSYGEGLQGNVRSELERVGVGGDRVKLLTYDPPADSKAPPVNFTAGAEEIRNYGADAVLVIGFAESTEVIKALAAAKVEFVS